MALDLAYRDARPDDLPVLVAMLADDPLGATREGAADDPAYARALDEVARSPGQRIVVAEGEDGIVGMLQLVVMPGLARRGMRRGQIEAVRVAAPFRGQGVGERLIRWAIEACRAEGCGLVQLTSDRARADAHRFYERLGFAPSHLGYKLALDP